MKYFLGIILFAISFACQADEMRTVITNQAVFAQHSIVTCCADEIGKCKGPFRTLSNGNSSNLYTPNEYAGLAGYKVLYKVGFMQTERGCDKYLLEVSNYSST